MDIQTFAFVHCIFNTNTAFVKTGRGVWKVDVVEIWDYAPMYLLISLE
jgi:hypothetical protein